MRAALLGARSSELALSGAVCHQHQVGLPSRSRGTAAHSTSPGSPSSPTALSDVQNRCLSVNTPVPDGNQPNRPKQDFLCHSDMLKSLSPAFCLSDKPARLSEIVPYRYFERSWNFFRSAGKALDVGHRWADVLKPNAVLNRPSTSQLCGRKPENLHRGQLLQTKAMDFSLETLWRSNTFSYSECSFEGVYQHSREPGTGLLIWWLAEVLLSCSATSTRK